MVRQPTPTALIAQGCALLQREPITGNILVSGPDVNGAVTTVPSVLNWLNAFQNAGEVFGFASVSAARGRHSTPKNFIDERHS